MRTEDLSLGTYRKRPCMDSVRTYAEIANNSQAVRNFTFSTESPQTSSHGDSDFVVINC